MEELFLCQKDMGIEQEKVQNRQELRRVNVRYGGRVSFTNKCAHLLLVRRWILHRIFDRYSKGVFTLNGDGHL